MDILYTVAGFLVGFVVGLTGVGGGSLMTPILVLGFGFAPAIAVGTDLLFAAVTKCGGVFVHNRRRTIEWRIAGLLALGSVPATVIAIWLLKGLQARGINYEGLITSSLSIALILTSLVLMFKTRLVALSQNERLSAVRVLHRRFQAPMTIAAGVVLGFLVTFSSIGAGALGAAILFFLYPRLRAISIVGTDLAHAVPLTAIAGLGHMHLGTVDFVLLASLLLGSLPGIFLGSHLGTNLPDKVVRPVLASMLLMIGLRFAL
ncbi:MAG: sulfite exporter TauE/SafE family protein [Gammaproteobacteria bacterium]|nr:sulfite exporter TauE/SafE family protein [Gammaproteobacteria bacterium]